MPTGREAGDSVPEDQDTIEGRTSTEVRDEAKSVEFTYRGIFQKTLAANLSKHVVMAARKRDWLGSTIQRYSDSPERKVIPRKPWDWTLAIVPGTPSMGGLWVYRDDGTDMRVLGAIASARPDIFELDAIEAVVRDSELGQKYLDALKSGHDEVRVHEVSAGEGKEDDYEPVKLPGWKDMREAIIVEAVKLGERNPHYRSSSDRTMRPVVNFDTCIKCRQCWIDCPDECFDISDEELHPVNYSYCTGCGICANVCPVEDCIVMVNDLEFVEEGDEDVFPMWKEDKDAYHEWREDKIARGRIDHQAHFNADTWAK